MFNTESWSRLTEKTYNYNSRFYNSGSFKLYYSEAINDIGHYLVSPSFGDYIEVNTSDIDVVESFISDNSDKAIKLKLCSLSEDIDAQNSSIKHEGYIHQINFDSYNNWYKNVIRRKFRNQISQGVRNNLKISITNNKHDVRNFWEMHANLRLSKFKEIPQPWAFFENIYDEYFINNQGHVIMCYDNKDDLIAGVLFLIHDNKAYYKFNASNINALDLRPNNLIMDRLIHFLSQNSIKSLNLGYTGSSEAYIGLRKYKLGAGATEYKQYSFTNTLFKNLDKSKITSINDNIKTLIAQNPSLEKVDTFSNKYYRYFI